MIKWHVCANIKHLNDSEAFIEYSNDMSNIYKNIEDSSANKHPKYWSFLVIWLLICLVIKKLSPTVTELFVKDTKLNISSVFITQSYSFVPNVLD